MTDNPFVQFTNLLQGLYSDPATPDNCRTDTLLAMIQDHNRRGQPLCITDLVKMERFGTLPTLSKHLAQMQQSELIRIEPGPDRRTRLVMVAEKGKQLLKERAAALLSVVKPASSH